MLGSFIFNFPFYILYRFIVYYPFLGPYYAARSALSDAQVKNHKIYTYVFCQLFKLEFRFSDDRCALCDAPS